MMQVYLSGQGVFAVQVASALSSAGHGIVGLATPDLRRGGTVEADPAHWDRLRAWGYPRSIPWVKSTDLREKDVPEATDVIVAAHSHAFIGRRTRRRAREAAIGYHPSLLPLHRGRDAIRWTIRDRDKVSGGTVYHLTDRTDAGPIAAQEHVLVPPGSTPASLWRDLLAPLGVRLLTQVVARIARGQRIEVPQDEDLATWEPAFASAPLFKPELIELPGARPVDGHRWAIHQD